MKKLLKHAHTIPWLLFILFTSIYFSSTVGIMNSSDAPQYALTRAMSEKFTFRIEDYSKWVYPDYAEINGKMYSLRMLGESLFMMPFYILGKILLPLANDPYYNLYRLGIDRDSKLESLTVLADATFGALLLVVIYCFVYEITKNKQCSVLTSLIGGLGTLFWRYSSQIQRYPIASFFILSSFYCLYKINISKKGENNYLIAILSICLGCAIITDLTLLFIASIIFFSAFFIICKGKKKLTNLIYLIIPFTIPVIMLLLYNQHIFGSPFSSAYKYHTKPYYRDISKYYTIPLFPSFFTNLFSNAPIPPYVFGDLWNNIEFRNNEGMIWASRYTYKGIFTQSPVLIIFLLVFFGYLRKNFLKGMVLISIPLLYIIQTSKYIVFFGPNSYDTHYFLPAIPFLLLGLGIGLAELFKLKTPGLKTIIFLICSILTCISIYNGWYANLTNYAPHVTGEHRFSFEQLKQPILSQNNILENLRILFINTFPNIYNLHLLILIYFPLCYLVYLSSKKIYLLLFHLSQNPQK